MKPLGELSPREIEHDNPEIRRVDELARWLGQLYNREVAGERHGDRDPLLADHRQHVLGGSDRVPTCRACGSGRRRARPAAPRHRILRTRRGTPTGTGPRTRGRDGAPRLRSSGRCAGAPLRARRSSEREAAADAERDPVPERLAPLLLDPVPLRPLTCSHRASLARARPGEASLSARSPAAALRAGSGFRPRWVE